MKRVHASELLRVGAVEAHDLAGGRNAPEVGRGSVAEAGEQAVRAPMDEWRRVEVELGVAQILFLDERPRQPLLFGADVGANRLGEVADAHVVGGDGEVVATELRLSEREIAPRRGERLGRVEALVESPTPALERGD